MTRQVGCRHLPERGVPRAERDKLASAAQQVQGRGRELAAARPDLAPGPAGDEAGDPWREQRRREQADGDDDTGAGNQQCHGRDGGGSAAPATS